MHDEALSRAAEQRGGELDELTEMRDALQPLGSVWAETDPVTPERVAIQPALYDDFATLLAERLGYLEAVEMATIEAGDEVVAGARAESDRITRQNRQTLLGLLAIGLGILVFEFAIIRSLRAAPSADFAATPNESAPANWPCPNCRSTARATSGGSRAR